MCLLGLRKFVQNIDSKNVIETQYNDSLQVRVTRQTFFQTKIF